MINPPLNSRVYMCMIVVVNVVVGVSVACRVVSEVSK